MPGLSALVRRWVPGARLVEDVGREVVFNVPYRAARDGSLADLLRELDCRQGELGVSSYGVSDTSLEEVRESSYYPPRCSGGGHRFSKRHEI